MEANRELEILCGYPRGGFDKLIKTADELGIDQLKLKCAVIHAIKQGHDMSEKGVERLMQKYKSFGKSKKQVFKKLILLQDFFGRWSVDLRCLFE